VQFLDLFKNKLVKNISWLFFDKIFRMAYGIFISVLVARYLGPVAFGELNFSIAFVYVFLVISSLGMEQVLIRELTLTKEKRNQIISTSLIMRGVASSVVYLLVIAMVVCYNPGVSSDLLVIIIGTQIILQITDVFFAVFMAEVNSKYVVLAKNIGFLLSGLVKLVLVFMKFSLVWFALATVVEFFVCSLLIIWFFKSKTDIRISLKYWDKQIGKQILNSSYPLIISSVFYVIYTKLDQVMLGYLTSSDEVGYYAVAAKLSEVWYFIPSAIVNSFYPELVKLKEQDSNSFKILTLRLMTVLSALAFCIALFFTFFSDILIESLYGIEYITSGKVLTIHIWSCIIVFSAVVSGAWFVINRLEKYSFYRTGTGALVNVALNFILIPAYGALGAAAATLVAKLIASYLMNGMFAKTKPVFLLQTKAYFNVLKIRPVFRISKKLIHDIKFS
jgi:O-antigen/teichoic acid export membrane protein